MNRLFRGWAIAAAVLSGGLLMAAPALAGPETDGQMKVEDDAGLFTADGMTRAKERFEGTTFKSTTHYTVVTKSKVPSGKQAELDAVAKDDAKRGRFFADWARELARSTDRKGDVFTLVFRSEKGAYQAVTVADRQSDLHRHFGDKKANDVANEFIKSFKRVKDQKLEGDAAKKEMDEALLAATQHVIDDLKDTAAPEAGHQAAAGTGRAERKGGSGIMSYICIGLSVLLGIWLVVALIRMFTGGGGGGGSGGGGGYGGGGGFFPSLLGGLFGAAAGMYLYDSFMGGHHGSDAMASDNYGDTGGDTGDGDYGGGSEGGGGGDWGDGGGGDAGAGGDWGGGGGDLGGGGGDFGGGGDW